MVRWVGVQVSYYSSLVGWSVGWQVVPPQSWFQCTLVKSLRHTYEEPWVQFSRRHKSVLCWLLRYWVCQASWVRGACGSYTSYVFR
mmetsp:Transcript_79774/g.138425  ORF Transcript_79774/g.138425 Transcript_79774/m.138425 type:complete len:86 (+) Transcript_79774:347-604(+)